MKWKPQEAGGARNMDGLTGKAAGSKQSKPTSTAMRAAGARLPKPFGIHMFPPYAPDNWHAVRGLNVFSAYF